MAAIATGLAGAVALARRDVAAVLPGVAIAISLVPPLAVAGVCLGQGQPGLAVGALVLFVSNLVAMVSAGILMFAALYGAVDVPGHDRRARRPYTVLGVLTLVLLVPLGANTATTYVLSRYSADVEHATADWLKPDPGASVTKVSFTSLTEAHVYVRHTGQLPPYSELLRGLQGVVPDGIAVYVDSSVGTDEKIGTVGHG